MKKFSLLCILSSLVCIWATYAYTTTDVSNATFLADQNVVVKQSVASKYRLDDTILRQEVIGMALKIKWITLPENYKCKKYFADATQNNWECRAVELAADNGIITRENRNANPGKLVTRAEALAMVMKAGGIETGTYLDPMFNQGREFTNVDITTMWIYTVFENALYTKIIDINTLPKKKDPLMEINGGWKYYFYPNRSATRTEVFAFAKSILLKKSSESSESSLSKQCVSSNFSVPSPCEKNTWNGWNDIITYWKIWEEFNQCTIYFMKETSIHNISLGSPRYEKYWLYDVVTLSWSNKSEVSRIFAEWGTFVLSYSWNIADCPKISLEWTRKLNYKDILILYYRNIWSTINDNWYLSKQYLWDAYNMRSPSGVSLETFTSWYKNTEKVTLREDTLKSLWDNTYEFLVDMKENGVTFTYKVKSKVNLEKFTIDNISSVKQ